MRTRQPRHFERAGDGAGLERGCRRRPNAARYLDAYMNDPRRLAMAAERDAAIARTDLFRIQPASRPEPEH
jgi:hypothetical protein